ESSRERIEQSENTELFAKAALQSDAENRSSQIQRAQELRLRVEDEKRGKSKPEAQDSEGEVSGFRGAVMSERIEIDDAHDQERLNCVGQGEAIFPEGLRQIGVKPGIQSGPQE